MTKPIYQILLVEDNEVNQEVFQEMLDNLGYAVTVAGNGKEALHALIKDEGIHLILMDCQMPVMDGYTASGKIRTLEKAQGDAHTPIIALTAHAMDGERDRCLAAGMDDYLTKPVRSASLDGMLQKWLVPAESPEAVVTTSSEDEATTLSVNRDDLETMRQEVGGKVGRILSKFLEALPGRVNKMRESVDQGDPNLLRQAAHTLKGSSGVVCAERLSLFCGELEDMAKSGDIGQAPAILAKMDVEVTLVQPVLAEIIAAEQ